MHSGFDTFALTPKDFNHTLSLSFDDAVYRLQSNSQPLLKALATYFNGYESQQKAADCTIYLYQGDTQNNNIHWQDWPREAGKTRQKEQYYDAEDGRWVHKIKTGMLLFQHLSAPLAIGPCESYLSQTVNFIINQHINALQQNGGLICHAACLQVAKQGVAIAAMSGGGKSTTMLKLLDLPKSQFISNDRLFLFADDAGVTAKGVAKQPRVNPGTLLNNPKLINILSAGRQQELRALSKAELWQLEEKYDVMVEQIYGSEALGHSAPLNHVVLLNWQPGNKDPVSVNSVSLDQKPSLIKAIAKSPGSFYQDVNGKFLASALIPDDNQYQDALRKVKVWEVTGGADFEQLSLLLQEKLGLL